MKDSKYIEAIENVAKLMDKHGLSIVSYNESEWNIHLTKNGGYGYSGTFFPTPGGGMNPQAATPTETSNLSETSAVSVALAASESSTTGTEEVKSPMVGVFYNVPYPEAEPFVRIGDTVKKGDVLCLLEAMKLMNEIQAEKDGKITDICVKNGDVVEFGQTLFKFEGVAL